MGCYKTEMSAYSPTEQELEGADDLISTTTRCTNNHKPHSKQNMRDKGREAYPEKLALKEQSQP